MKSSKMSTLCYIERNNSYLMLHRIKKENDVNKDKWIGVGGHFEHGESPEDCLVREVKEETGYELKEYSFRGIVTFVYGNKNDEVVEYMHLFKGFNVVGDPINCNEGVLEWIPKKDLFNLDLWDGDKIFLELLNQDCDFFSLKLVYDEEGTLLESVLDGKAWIRT